ncbi:MAG: hypothetical protein AB8B80_07065 [Marinicellaceae bacterium]
MFKAVCNLVTLLTFLLFFSSSYSQEVTDTENNDEENITTDVIKNEFEQLLSSQSIVYQLRKKYGIRGSVLLSKSMWQILTSFSNQQQAENIWETAIKSVTNINEVKYPPHVNLEFSSGQVLSKFTNGMSLEKWRNNRIYVQLSRKNIEDTFAYNDDLTIYMQLDKIWEIILLDIIKQENIMWNEVFIDSINLFAELDEAFPLDENINEELSNQVIVELMQWQNSENLESQLADLVQKLEKARSLHGPLSQSFIRFALNKHHEYYLASSLSWYELTYQLSQIKSELSEQDKSLIQEYIEQNDLWFMSNELKLMTVNKKIPEWIESSISNLKQFYNSEDQVFNLNELMPNAFQLIEPQFNKYMATPFRREIRSNLEVCLNISEEYRPLPQLPISVNQYMGCMNDFSNAASVDAKTQGLSGNLSKIESTEAFDRALKLPAWQNINILYANQASNDCLNDSKTLANPFEWALAAESLLWFSDRWPGYVANYPQASDFNKTIAEGEKLINGFDCLEKPNIEILKTQFNQIDLSWQNVKTQIKQVANEFNENNLSKGSDIDLLVGSDKPSNYRVEGAIIEACDDLKSCGVHVDLESSRALFGLYPNHLLMADQLKLGQLKLCYDNVGWENRRSASTHLDNDSVANYFGNFSFSIKGFYEEELIFERKLISNKEHHYLFAENNQEVLSAYCPLSIIGSKISTTLKQGTYGLVPNRLTFLTASRANESKIIATNWSKGEEWKDQITADSATVISENPYEEMSAMSQQAYQQKAKALQDLIYITLLNRNSNPTEAQTALTDAFTNMNRMTQVFSQLLYVMYMDDLLTNDSLHGMIFGMDKIPNINQLDEYYKNQLNINQLIQSVDENMKNNQIKWNNFTSFWSHAYLRNILYRLKSKR